MFAQTVELTDPEFAIAVYPRVQFHPNLGPDRVYPLLGVLPDLDQPGLSQHPQVARDRRLRQRQQRGPQFSGGAVAFGEQVDEPTNQHRESKRHAAIQSCLLPESALTVSEERAINLETVSYEPSWLYEGRFQFQNHYFGKPGELAETTPSGKLTEEFQCAQFIDESSEVRFWVRNLVRKPTSFQLQTSSDWFFPDFVCQPVDGRVLVVEHKGKDRYIAEDAMTGRQLERQSRCSPNASGCLFVFGRRAHVDYNRMEIYHLVPATSGLPRFRRGAER